MPVPSNDLPFWAWLEDYTNVHIEWECIPSASYDEVLSARLAAGQDLADVIVVGGTSLRSAGQNGTVIDIAPYYDELCTNLQAYFRRQRYGLRKSLIATTDGAIYGLAGTINARENRITALYNTEWLQKLNLPGAHHAGRVRSAPARHQGSRRPERQQQGRRNPVHQRRRKQPARLHRHGVRHAPLRGRQLPAGR